MSRLRRTGSGDLTPPHLDMDVPVHASCASATPAAPPSAADLVGVTWLLEDLAGDAPVDGSPVTVHFADDGALFGSGGCNRFAGTYEIDGGTITVGGALPPP